MKNELQQFIEDLQELIDHYAYDADFNVRVIDVGELERLITTYKDKNE